MCCGYIHGLHNMNVIEVSLSYVCIFSACFRIVSVMNLVMFTVWAIFTRHSEWALCRGPPCWRRVGLAEELVLDLGWCLELHPESVWPAASWIWQAYARKKNVSQEELVSNGIMEKGESQSGQCSTTTVCKEKFTLLQRTPLWRSARQSMVTLNIHLT